MKVLYRIQESLTGTTDEFERLVSMHVKLEIMEYEILSKTPCGVWIRDHRFSSKGKRFVLLFGRKRFAHPTIEEAITSFRHRKERQKRILEHQMDICNKALKCIETFERTR